ncbi:MAG: HD domain-containing phosphohydrolase [Bryobacteraceae bacterium]
MRLRGKLYIGFVTVVGFAILLLGLSQWESQDLVRYACFFLLAALTSSLKLSLPGVTGTMSLSFLFILMGIVEMSFPETLFLGAMLTLFQCLWNKPRRPRPEQILFNVASMSIAIAITEAVCAAGQAAIPHADTSLLLLLAGGTFFFANSLPVAVVIGMTESRPLSHVWRDCYFWSFPYYLAGAGIASLANLVGRYAGWQTSMLVIPLVYLLYRSYRLYLSRLEVETLHAQEMAALHLRTIEALALAIEAKDSTTHDHLQRVQTYAMEIGKELGLGHDEREALRTAALLHDIGKLAVPEHIISKPGRLTPEEFEKMKIHPVIGAEILDRVQFPYPVAPIVAAHHEKWNGTGYPNSLAGERIPIGARILSAVDCLDALASDRQYRRALPLEEAMAKVEAESGTSFDPKVVAVLKRRFVELERMARGQQCGIGSPAPKLRMARGVEPAAGFETAAAPAGADGPGRQIDFLQSIAAARQEVQGLYELTQNLGSSLSLDETLSVLAVRLRRMVPHDSMAIYVRRGERLIPEYVNGDEFRLFASLEIPVGHGLSGWVVENCRPILNGNPSVEPGYLNDPAKFSTLRSALSAPLEGAGGVIGALTLYASGGDAFTRDHLRILLAISSKVALSIENALKYKQAENSATTDYLTGLPNARSLFLHLDGELARCRRAAAPLAVLVCDLNGFKQVNDDLGHLEGNRLLQNVACALRGQCREYDYIARMGGDEFVAILPGLQPDAVAAKAASFSLAVKEVGRTSGRSNVLSLSIGQAHFPDDGDDAEQLLAAADRRMYKNKQSYNVRRDSAATVWTAGLPAGAVQ